MRKEAMIMEHKGGGNVNPNRFSPARRPIVEALLNLREQPVPVSKKAIEARKQRLLAEVEKLRADENKPVGT